MFLKKTFWDVSGARECINTYSTKHPFLIPDHKSFAKQKLLGSIKNAPAFFTRKGENSADSAKQNQASECNYAKL